MKKRILPLVFACLLLVGCGEAVPDGSEEPVTAQDPDLSLMQMDVLEITVPETVQVVGLGEASHGVSEYQQMKCQVFQALVRNNGCRTFIIEGDFASARTVDAYIHGGEGTAQEAAAQIGFRIYRTQEMADLLDWMREYNETAPEGEDLHFCGMDMQWADASKEYLFQILAKGAPELEETYRPQFDFLTDEGMFDLTTADFTQGMTAAETLCAEMDAAQEAIEAVVGAEDFAFARACARNLYACCDVHSAPALSYNTTRDRYMAERVQWFLEQGDGSLLFINGHNGHIAKGGITNYACLGQNLSGTLGDKYFAIGTDAAVTDYNSQTDEGDFVENTVENENALNVMAREIWMDDLEAQGWQARPPLEGVYYYIDFAAAASDPGWAALLSEEQSVTTLNVGGPTTSKALYTSRIIPQDSFDAMIVFFHVFPSTLTQ